MFEKTKKISISETLSNGEVFNAEIIVRRPTLKDRLRINQLQGMYAGVNPNAFSIYQAEVVATIEVLVENLPEQLRQDKLDAADFWILEKIYQQIVEWVNFFRSSKKTESESQANI